MDEEKYTSIERIANEDNLLDIKDDNILTLGKHRDDPNRIILIPKTEKRATNEDMTLKKLIEDRTEQPETRKALIDRYRGREWLNLKKVRLKIDTDTLEIDKLLGYDISTVIVDTASESIRQAGCKPTKNIQKGRGVPWDVNIWNVIIFIPSNHLREIFDIPFDNRFDIRCQTVVNKDVKDYPFCQQNSFDILR